MLKLNYHQATYDLLTQKPINPQHDIELYTQYCSPHDCGDEITEERRQQNEKSLERALTWTRLDLYQHPAQFSEKNIHQLDTLEQHQVKLPAAVREWYSLDIAPEIMSARLPSFGFTPINDFMPYPQRAARFPWLSEPRQDLWYFLFSEFINQGGEDITFKIDAGDDPPVFAQADGESIELASSFSEFIFYYFWDWHASYMFRHHFSMLSFPGNTSRKLPAQYRIPVQRLRERYCERTNQRGMRFYDDHTRIWVILDQDDQTLVIDGSFRADSMIVLEDLIRWLWGNDVPVFRINDWTDDEASRALIDRLQYERMRRALREAHDWIRAEDLANQLNAVLPVLSWPMMKQVTALIAAGEAEAHPDNRNDNKAENRWRAT